MLQIGTLTQNLCDSFRIEELESPKVYFSDSSERKKKRNTEAIEFSLTRIFYLTPFLISENRRDLIRSRVRLSRDSQVNHMIGSAHHWHFKRRHCLSACRLSTFLYQLRAADEIYSYYYYLTRHYREVCKIYPTFAILSSRIFSAFLIFTMPSNILYIKARRMKAIADIGAFLTNRFSLLYQDA